MKRRAAWKRRRIGRKKELRLTGVGVRIPGKNVEDLPSFPVDVPSILPWNGGAPALVGCTEISGRAGRPAGGDRTRSLYEKDGTRYQSPYYFLGSQTAVSDTVFWGRQENTDVFAAFSMPRQRCMERICGLPGL